MADYGEFCYGNYLDQYDLESRYQNFRDKFNSQGVLMSPRTNLQHFDFHGRDGKVGILFEALLDHKAAYLSFSQRKFIGFRQRFEFDQKRILLAS